jgi:hypothetical protein
MSLDGLLPNVILRSAAAFVSLRFANDCMRATVQAEQRSIVWVP